VIYRYHFDGSNVNDAVVLRDARHGNEVGRYNPYQGGLTTHK
jgi:ribosomal protein S16